PCLFLFIRTHLIYWYGNSSCTFITCDPTMDHFCFCFHSLFPLVFIWFTLRNIFLLIYRSLLSGKTVTMLVPAVACSASFKAANIADPEELPTSNPSFSANLATMSNASSSETV